MYMYTQMLNIE